MAQALLLTVLLVVAAATLSTAIGSRWPLAALMIVMLGAGVTRMDWRRDIWQPYRSLRARHFALGALALLLPLTTYLATADLPVLGWSLLELLGQEGGNIAGAGLEFGPLVALPYALLLLAALPTLALVEEAWFRRGTRGWSDGAVRSLLFGMAHMLVGVPLGVAVFGLGAVGMIFTSVYLRAAGRPAAADQRGGFPVERFASDPTQRRGMAQSARLHLAYNTVAIGLGIVALLLEALSSLAG
jgi:hypothetical protein